MTDNTDSVNPTASTHTWQLNALTEALGDLRLTVDDSLSVGRGSDNDVVLGSKQVSRNHAVLSLLDGQLYVKDLNSSNGTFINEQRIEGNKSSLLQADDTIGFASFSFQVSAPVAATESESDTLLPVMTEDAAAVDTNTTNDSADTHIDAAISETTAKEDEFEEYIIEHPTIDEPVVKETGITDMLPATEERVETVPVDTASEVAVESINEVPETSMPTVESIDTIEIAEPVVQEPVVKETGIDDVLSAAENVSAAESVETAPVEETVAPIAADEPAIAAQQEVTAPEPELIASEPLVEQPDVQEESAVQEEPAVAVEHDKTTKTELQEEADPDVLRAKQAATSQLSGTANLGQSRDLGTTGNNAADQAVSNPASAARVEKKPSGGWFLWVFIAIIIIALALWLFNKGIV